MTDRYDVDVSRFPIVRSTLSDAMDLDRFDDMLRRYYDYVLDRNELYVSVIDARELHAIPSAKVRKIIADHRRRAVARGVDRLLLGYATITTNRFLRSTIAVIDWVSPLTKSWLITESPEEAIAWADALIARGRAASIPP